MRLFWAYTSLEMEAVVNGSVAAKRPSARSTTLDADAARDLLNYFEIDENEKEFLISAITSSKAHEDEVKALLHDRAFSSHTSEDDTSEDDDNQNDNAPAGRHYIPWRTPENPEAPPMDENTARNLLCGFNIDDDLREFLMAIIMSGKVFEDDLRHLYKIGLSAGWETFQAQVQCAKSLRDKVLARHYGDDLTWYLGMMRESDQIPDFKEKYWPLGAPALNASHKLVAGKHLWGGLVDGNTTSLQSIQLVHDDDSQINNGIVPMDRPPPDWVASNPQPTKTASDATTKKTKTKTQSTEQTPTSANDARFEVVCPIRRQDGSVCNKRCYDGKAYRSMQEHIRKVHKDHYIPGLNANEESFRRMVNNTTGAEPNLQQATGGAKSADEQAGGVSAQLIRPADLSLPLANGAPIDAGKQQRVTKKAKQSHEKPLAKSPFFVDQGQHLMDVNASMPVSRMIPAQPALSGPFDERQFLSQFDRGQDGFGSMALGLDATISQSLFPQHVDGIAQSSGSSDRKRKREDADTDMQNQSSNQNLSYGLNGSTGEVYNPPVDPSLFFQTLPSQPAPPVAPDVFDEMIDILGQLQEASRENNAIREMSGSNTGHYNPPAEPTASQALSAKRNPFATPTPATKAKPAAQKQAASHFFVSPTSKKIDDARTAAVTPSPTPKKTSRPARNTVSALPIPPLAGDRFGLVQEELAGEPFRLLVAVTFLIRTPGRVAIPVFRQLMERYPTAQALAEADPADIEAMMHHLGLSNQRTKTIQKYARTWLERPPSRDVRYGVKDYPQKGDGKGVRAGEMFGPEDHSGTDKVVGVVGSPDSSKENDPQAKTTARGHGTAWEIGHLTTGRYALDSWRIFCRDVLLGRAQDWKGKGCDPAFQPEWMRVLPEDKELRACLRWMWMKEGWEWDPKTGEKTPLREEMRRAVDEGRVAYDNQGQLQILEKAGGQVDGNGAA